MSANAGAQGHATMMIMGEICTRGCTFCNVATGRRRRWTRSSRAAWPMRWPNWG
jgi:lipoate synthase